MAVSLDGSATKCPKCGGKPSWGYGYAGSIRPASSGSEHEHHTISELGSYLMCDDCSHVLIFNHDTGK